LYSRMYKTAYFILLLKCFGAYQPVFLLTPIRNAYAEAMTEYVSPDSIDKNKPSNSYPSGWVGSGYHLWLNYKGGKINAIDVVIRIENTKASHELKKMLQDSDM
jgi:hypothetical protein